VGRGARGGQERGRFEDGIKAPIEVRAAGGPPRWAAGRAPIGDLHLLNRTGRATLAESRSQGTPLRRCAALAGAKVPDIAGRWCFDRRVYGLTKGSDGVGCRRGPHRRRGRRGRDQAVDPSGEGVDGSGAGVDPSAKGSTRSGAGVDPIGEGVDEVGCRRGPHRAKGRRVGCRRGPIGEGVDGSGAGVDPIGEGRRGRVQAWTHRAKGSTGSGAAWTPSGEGVDGVVQAWTPSGEGSTGSGAGVDPIGRRGRRGRVQAWTQSGEGSTWSGPGVDPIGRRGRRDRASVGPNAQARLAGPVTHPVQWGARSDRGSRPRSCGHTPSRCSGLRSAGSVFSPAAEQHR